MKKLLAVLICAALAGCATTGNAPVPVPKTPRQTAAALEATVTALQTGAIGYATLPRCVTGGSPICATVAGIVGLDNLSQKAMIAVRAAEAVAVTTGAGSDFDAALGLANQAIQALSAYTSTLPKAQ